jgi:protein SCO1/2
MKPGRPALRQRRDRKPFATAAVLVAAILLLASGYSWLIGAGRGMPSRAAIGGPFELVQGDGQTVTDRSFRGKYLLVYFGYTSCEDVCPVTLTSMAAALEILGRRADRIQPLFITVDPARDTPPVVQRYTRAFMPQLVGLTGSPEAVSGVADAYRLGGVVRHAGAELAHYAIDHNSVIYLVGPDGRYIAPIKADQAGPAMATAIGHYVP